MADFTIAIVDDDAAIRRLVRLFLRRAGYGVIECTDGAEARASLRKEAWDLVILDRQLPDLDGVVLAQELKANPDFRTRYVIMLTGEDEQEDKIEGLELGADDYITKPFQYPELLARIRAGKPSFPGRAGAGVRGVAALSAAALAGHDRHRFLQEDQ
jgi:DNA-binding response OmpR family regulator